MVKRGKLDHDDQRIWVSNPLRNRKASHQAVTVSIPAIGSRFRSRIEFGRDDQGVHFIQYDETGVKSTGMIYKKGTLTNLQGRSIHDFYFFDELEKGEGAALREQAKANDEWIGILPIPENDVHLLHSVVEENAQRIAITLESLVSAHLIEPEDREAIEHLIELALEVTVPRISGGQVRELERQLPLKLMGEIPAPGPRAH